MTLFTRNRTAAAVAVLVATGLLPGLSPAVGSEVNIVAPAGLENSEGNERGGSGAFTPFRTQFLYPASDFVSRLNGKTTISKIAWRLDRTETSPITLSMPDSRITLATTDKMNLDGSDLDSNLEFDAMVVFDGLWTVTFPAGGPRAGPRPFNSGITLQTPFVYDPSEEKNLVIEFVTSTGTDDSAEIDFQTTSNISRVITGDTSNTGDQERNVLVQQFTFVPEPPQRS